MEMTGGEGFCKNNLQTEPDIMVHDDPAILYLGPREVDWYKWNERWEFNHRAVDNGMDAPTPMSDLQKSSWKGAKWKKETVEKGPGSNG